MDIANGRSEISVSLLLQKEGYAASTPFDVIRMSAKKQNIDRHCFIVAVG